jgi:hypothetical protein
MAKPKTIKKVLQQAGASILEAIITSQLRQLGINPVLPPAKPKKTRSPKTIDLSEKDYTILK